MLFYAGILNAQDTVLFPLKVRAGIDVVGPGIYFSDKNNFNLEGHISLDRSEKMAYVLEGGYLDYKYSQYNYDYQAKGIFLRAGVDFNLLKPEVSSGRFWAGLGLRYGLSTYNSETTSFQFENYWGKVTSSVPRRTSMGHFFEVAPGVRTELFRNFSIGWSIRLKFLISAGGGKDLRPIYFPGYGTGSKTVNAGINYYLVWSIPFRTKTVITKPEVPEETEETQEVNKNQTQQPSY
jgi:hypothetical protein